MSRMTITNPRYEHWDGEGPRGAGLAFELDGEPVMLNPEMTKKTFLDAGLVFVPELEGKIPPATVVIDGVPREFDGFTDDPVLVTIYRKFWTDAMGGTWKPGPIP